MPLLETVVLTLGPAIGKSIARVWLDDSPLGAQVSSTVIDLLRGKTQNILAQNNAQRQIDAIADRVSENLLEFFQAEGEKIEEESRTAIALAVSEVFNSSAVNAEIVIEVRSEPTELASRLIASNPRVAIHFSSAEEEFFKRVLVESCRYLIDIASQLPSYSERSITEILLQNDLIISKANLIIDEFQKIREESQSSNSVRATARFEGDYRLAVVRSLDNIQLFGADVDNASRRHQLSIAYIPLSARKASLNRDGLSEEKRVDPSEDFDDTIEFVKIDEALHQQRRVVIRGQAGSGKTTLMQWLAVRSASRTFQGKMLSWNDTVPFFIRLRQFVEDRLQLPELEKFPQIVAPFIGVTPEGWVHSKLQSGQAIVLVDGIDEVPSNQRGELADWIEGLSNQFPLSKIVVTSRPHALDTIELDRLGFLEIELQSMELDDIQLLVEHWHDAVRGELRTGNDAEELDNLSAKLIVELKRNRSLRILATSPLLCSMLCALNRHRGAHLPVDRIELYNACIEMLIERRETARGIDLRDYPNLTFRQKYRLLQDLAYWMMRNSWSEVRIIDVDEKLQSILPGLDQSLGVLESSAVRRLLVERTGVVREPVAGYMDFTHRTFQEFLAAHAVAYEHDLGVLQDKALDDQWRNVIVLAAGVVTRRDRETIIRGLIEEGDRNEDERHRLHLLALASLETSLDLDPALRQEVRDRVGSLVPPKSMSDAKDLASAGDLVVPLLAQYRRSRASIAAACIRTLALIGGDAALDAIEGFASDSRQTVINELLRDWQYFEYSEEYANRVIGRVSLPQKKLSIERMSNLALLAVASGLEELSLISLTQLTDLSILTRLVGLKELSLQMLERVDNLIPLSDLAELTKLRIRGLFEISDLSPLMGLHRLEELELWGCPEIIDLEPLRSLKSLRRLSLIGCRRVETLDPLADLSELSTLHISFPGPLRDLSPLRGLRKLESLVVGGFEELENIEPLAEILSLRHLTIRDCKPLKDLAPLSALSSLRTLRLVGLESSISLQPVASLTNLQRLEIADVDRPIGELYWPRSLFDDDMFFESRAIAEWRLQTRRLYSLESYRVKPVEIRSSSTGLVKSLDFLDSLESLTHLTLRGFDRVRSLDPVVGLEALERVILAGFGSISTLEAFFDWNSDALLALEGFENVKQLQPLAHIARSRLRLSGFASVPDEMKEEFGVLGWHAPKRALDFGDSIGESLLEF